MNTLFDRNFGETKGTSRRHAFKFVRDHVSLFCRQKLPPPSTTHSGEVRDDIHDAQATSVSAGMTTTR